VAQDCRNWTAVVEKAMNNRQFIKIPKLPRHVSGNSYAQLQEHQTVEYRLLYSTV
jgi:hypothetical protein